MTNELKFEEVFGHDLNTTCFAESLYREECDGKCNKCPYHYSAEYHAPKGVKNDA